VNEDDMLPSGPEQGLPYGWASGLFDIWSAYLDRKTCTPAERDPNCWEFDGQMVPTGKLFPGGVTTPLHPFCRCTIITKLVPRAFANRLPGVQIDYAALKEDIQAFMREERTVDLFGKRHAQEFLELSFKKTSPEALAKKLAEQDYFTRGGPRLKGPDPGAPYRPKPKRLTAEERRLAREQERLAKELADKTRRDSERQTEILRERARQERVARLRAEQERIEAERKAARERAEAARRAREEAAAKAKAAAPAEPRSLHETGGALADAIARGDEATAREIVREHLRHVFPNAESKDVALQRAGAGRLRSFDLAAIGCEHAEAVHMWDGAILFDAQVHARLEHASRQLAAGAARTLTPLELDSIRVLVHEELHGYSRMASTAYVRAGKVVEEIGTELSARYAVSKLPGFERQYGALQSGAYEPEIRKLVEILQQEIGSLTDLEARLMIVRAHGRNIAAGALNATDMDHVETFVKGLDATPAQRDRIFVRVLDLRLEG
jgi:hypothetical protein